jgi:hypothetical protein
MIVYEWIVIAELIISTACSTMTLVFASKFSLRKTNIFVYLIGFIQLGSLIWCIVISNIHIRGFGATL